jgi:hypothetical protein
MKTIHLEKYLSEFIERTKDIAFEQEGAFKSELFLLYSLHRGFESSLFVESGLQNGFSTRVLLSLINETYYGVDAQQHCRAADEIGEGKTYPYPNFLFQCGNAFDHVEKFIKQAPDKNVSVFIDGPKGREAIRLKNQILNHNQNVAFVGLHDTYDGLQSEDHLRFFESSGNEEYNKKYYNLLNKSADGVMDVFGLINNASHCSGKPYSDCYPSGPGISLYSNRDVHIEL